MSFIDKLELKLELNNQVIDFESLVDEVLSENYEEEVIEDTLNNFGGLRGLFNDLKRRFESLFNLYTLTPVNGHSTIQISTELNAKNYLHNFLVNMSNTGGENASTEGSDKLFEEISANSVRNFLGDSARIIMVGQGNSRLTEEHLEEIAEKLNESIGTLENLPPQAQDDGVDFIIYKPIDNRNEGNIIILGQACVGKHYDRKKTIHKRWLNQYLNFSIHPPMKLLSIVHYLNPTKLKRNQSEFGGAIVFDRARILRYFDDSDDVLNNKIIDFIDNR